MPTPSRYAIRLLTTTLLLIWTTSASAQTRREDRTKYLRTSPDILALVKPIVARISESTVRISSDGKDLAVGTVVTEVGHIVTKASELKNLDNLVCKTFDGKQYPAQWIATHEPLDLALLKIPTADLKPVTWTSSKEALVGNWVISVGATQAPSAIGVVSVTTRNVPIRSIPTFVNPKDSGYLGVQLEPSEEGAKIVQVMPNSAASKAGLKASDIVLEISGKKIIDTESLINTIMSHKAGDKIQLKVRRGEETKEVTATLDKRPASLNFNRGDFQNSLGSELSQRRTAFPTFLQHDSVIAPRDCGGPLVDLDGRVLGLNIARAGRTESYAIPSEAVQEAIKTLLTGKSIKFEDIVPARKK